MSLLLTNVSGDDYSPSVHVDIYDSSGAGVFIVPVTIASSIQCKAWGASGGGGGGSSTFGAGGSQSGGLSIRTASPPAGTVINFNNGAGGVGGIGSAIGNGAFGTVASGPTTVLGGIGINQIDLNSPVGGRGGRATVAVPGVGNTGAQIFGGTPDSTTNGNNGIGGVLTTGGDGGDAATIAGTKGIGGTDGIAGTAGAFAGAGPGGGGRTANGGGGVNGRVQFTYTA